MLQEAEIEFVLTIPSQLFQENRCNKTHLVEKQTDTTQTEVTKI